MVHLLFAAALAVSTPTDVHLGSSQQGVVDATEPFEAAALTWSADSEVILRVRVSDDAADWSEWFTPLIDEDVTERRATAITHFGGPKRHVEYSFSAPVDQMTVTIFPPAGLRSAVPWPPHSKGGMHIRSRVDWGCPDGEGSRWTPAYTTVTHAVVHHTAGANSLPDWDAELRNIWYFHSVTNGWGDIGYNYLIDPNGVIYEGRAGGEGAIGAHFSCRNSNTVGIAMLGTYTEVAPTEAALASLESLLADLCKKDAITPAATAFHPPTGLMLPTILGHRDGNPSLAVCSTTTCPGDALYALLPSIRSELSPPPPTRRRAVKP